MQKSKYNQISTVAQVNVNTPRSLYISHAKMSKFCARKRPGIIFVLCFRVSSKTFLASMDIASPKVK